MRVQKEKRSDVEKASIVLENASTIIDRMLLEL